MQYYDYTCRVLYGDTDKLGISYYANYLVWFEAARTEYFRALGLPYVECEKRGYFLPVIEASVRYLSPSTYDDVLNVRTSVSEFAQTSIRFEYQIFKNSEPKPIANGFTVHVFVNQNMKPIRVPDEVKERVTFFKLLG